MTLLAQKLEAAAEGEAPSDPPRGDRYNGGKPKASLMPMALMVEVAKVATRGAEKYAPRNWEKGLSYCDCYDSLQRHATAWLAGQDLDPESGLPHLAHVAWNAGAILEFERRKALGETQLAALDDRAVYIQKEI